MVALAEQAIAVLRDPVVDPVAYRPRHDREDLAEPEPAAEDIGEAEVAGGPGEGTLAHDKQVARVERQAEVRIDRLAERRLCGKESDLSLRVVPHDERGAGRAEHAVAVEHED